MIGEDDAAMEGINDAMNMGSELPSGGEENTEKVAINQAPCLLKMIYEKLYLNLFSLRMKRLESANLLVRL